MTLDVIRSIPDRSKIIVWTKFLYSVRQIQERLQAEFSPDAVSILCGELDEHQRHEQIEHWRGDGRFLVATQATGGHGLTLVEAHHAIYYENGFKYSHRIQAEDRCHRIGQTKPVTYIDLVCTGSIDDRIQKALAKKQNVVQAFRRQIARLKTSGRARRERWMQKL